MARYIDEKDVYKLVEPTGTARVHCSQIDALQRADVAPKSEVDRWYHEYHVIKDELKQEKAYHRETHKLVDKYFVELQKAKSETTRAICAEIREEYELDGMTYLDEILCGHLKKFIDDLEKKYCGEVAPDTNDGRKKTNFDRIKEMSVEELSEFLCKLYFGEDCPPEYAKDLAKFFESEVNENG